MKFEIVNDRDDRDDQVVKFSSKINEVGDIRLFLNDVFVAYFSADSGAIHMTRLTERDIIRLKKIGIHTEGVNGFARLCTVYTP